MIPTGTLAPVELEKPWRTSAADTADRVATRADSYIDSARHVAVRTAIVALRDSGAPGTVRRAQAMRILTASVEGQARIAGLGSQVLPVCRACGSMTCRAAHQPAGGCAR